MPNTELNLHSANLHSIRSFNDKDYLHVAIAVISRGTYTSKNILISQRSKDSHLGGLWEFPGGKIDHGETIIQALHREIYEEIGLTITKAEPLISIPCHYPDNVNVLLEVWLVTEFKGRASAKEKQPIKWINQSQLSQVNFPAVNQYIINALNLPDSYAITENIDIAIDSNKQRLLKHFRTQCQRGNNLIQLRLKETDFSTKKIVLVELVQQLINISHSYHVNLQINSSHLKFLNHGQIDNKNLGIHLVSEDLNKFNVADVEQIKITYPGYISASCHSQDDVLKANQLNLDFIVISPVNKTSSHSQTEAIGWDNFKQFTKYAQMPVYALGGMELIDIEQAKHMGAQGIAGISCFSVKP